jgi:hypothetical protein
MSLRSSIGGAFSPLPWSSTVGLAPKQQRREARGDPLAYRRGHTGAVNPLGGRGSVLTSTVVKYRGLGSKATKTRSKGRPARLPPRPYRGSKPPGGRGSGLRPFVPTSGERSHLYRGQVPRAWLQSNKDVKQGTTRSLTAAAIQGQ